MAPPLQYSCLENPMDGGAWWATVHGVAKSQTRLSDFTFTVHFHALEKEMATHSSVLAWRVPGMGEPGGLPSMGPHRVGHVWGDLAAVVVNYYLLKYFLMAFLFVFFFWYSYDSNFVSFNIVTNVSEVVLISFNYFFLFSSLLRLFPPFYLPPHLSSLLPQLFYCWFLTEWFWSHLLHYWLILLYFF